MKSFVLAVAVLLTAIARSAAAAEPWEQTPRENAVMLYFSKSFGHERSGGLPLAFGLRWQQSSPFGDAPPTELLGLRFNSLGNKGLSAGGAWVLRLDSMKDEDGDGNVDSSWDSWSEPVFYLVGVLALAGALCLAEELICEKKRRSTFTESPGLGLRD